MVVLDSSFLVDIIQKDPAAIEKLKELENCRFLLSGSEKIQIVCQ